MKGPAGDRDPALGDRNHPLRVLYAHHVGRVAGAERSLLLLFRHLDPARTSPLLAAPAATAFAAAARAVGVPIVPVVFAPLRRVPDVLRAAQALRRAIRAHAVDLVHANGPQTNVPAALAGRLAGVPVVWHARNLIASGMRDVDRLLAPLATCIVCNSDAIRDRFRGSRAWERSITIMNAVDASEFNRDVPPAPLRGELALPAEILLVGIVGRIGLGKGHEYFVEAAIRLLEASAAACFLVVGDTTAPDDRMRIDALLRRVKDAGREDRIRFTGHRADVPRVMRALDVVVLASDAEPCGRVLFEAMASGRPIVGTRSGGTPEIVRDGIDGLLVPPRDAVALATAIARLVEDRALRVKLGESGAARARADFSVATHVGRLEAVYASVLADRTVRR